MKQFHPFRGMLNSFDKNIKGCHEIAKVISKINNIRIWFLLCFRKLFERSIYFFVPILCYRTFLECIRTDTNLYA